MRAWTIVVALAFLAGSLAAHAQSAFDPKAVQQPKARESATQTSQPLPPLLTNALKRTSLKEGRLYGFTAQYSLGLTSPQPTTCVSTVRFEPEPLPAPQTEDEIVVTAQRRSRANDWTVTPVSGERSCTTMLANLLRNIRSAFDRGDGILFAQDPTLQPVAPFTVLKDDARSFVVETAIAPTARTPPVARRTVGNFLRTIEINKATGRITRISDRLKEETTALGGLARTSGFDYQAAYAPVSGQCCVPHRQTTKMVTHGLGRTQEMTVSVEITEVRPQR